MYASATIGHANASEIRPTRHVDQDGERRTIRIRPGRSTVRRAAIAASYGFGR